MPAVNKLHVVTYVWRKGDDAPDVVAHQVLENAANPKAGVEGDATKAVLSQAQDYQCHGEAGTDNCTKCHGHAEERVIARLLDNDRVAVAWRKYHPLAANGVVQPGVPFEAEHEGLKVRVEARVVTDDAQEVLTPKAVSMLSLRVLEADLQKQHARAEQRDAVRAVVDAFVDGPLQQHRTQFDEITVRAKDLPGGAKALAAVDAGFNALDAALQKDLGAILKKVDLGPADQQAMAVRIQQETAKLPALLAPAIQLEANAKELVDAQADIRDLLARAALVETNVTRGKEHFGGLDVNALPGADLVKRGDRLLEDTRTKEGLTVADVRKQLEGLEALLTERETALAGALAAEMELRAAFDGRVQRLVDLKDGTLKAKLVDYAEACGAAPGFNVKYWIDKVQTAVDAVASKAVDVGGLSYDKAVDEKALKAAEAKVGPLTQALEALEADVKKRIEAYPTHAVRDVQLTPPSVWVKVKALRADGTIDATVNARNNGAHALVLDIKNEDGSVVHKSIALAKKGERATFDLAGVGKQFTFTVTAVGKEAERGASANLSRCVVSSGSALGVEGKGTVRHMPPLYFTPSPQQPNDAVAQMFDEAGQLGAAGVALAQQRIPGVE